MKRHLMNWDWNRRMTWQLGRFGWAIVLLLGIAVAGCAGRAVDYGPVVSPKPVSVLTFQLGNLAIADQTGAGVSPVSGFSVPPRKAVLAWANTRLSASPGQPGNVRFVVTEASATRVDLEKTPGVRGWFSKDQAEKVSLIIAGQIETRQSDGRLIATATARSEAFRTFIDGISPEDRRSGLDQLLKDTLQAFDTEMERQVRAEMPTLLR
jgi:hypothetical protein